MHVCVCMRVDVLLCLCVCCVQYKQRKKRTEGLIKNTKTPKVCVCVVHHVLTLMSEEITISILLQSVYVCVHVGCVCVVCLHVYVCVIT